MYNRTYKYVIENNLLYCKQVGNHDETYWKRIFWRKRWKKNSIYESTVILK